VFKFSKHIKLNIVDEYAVTFEFNEDNPKNLLAPLIQQACG
jgi:hypothetical protein